MGVIPTALQSNSLFLDWVIIGLGNYTLLQATAWAVMITDIDKLKMWSTVKMEASGQSSST